jgi:predicted CopG family antitoxin
MATKQIRVGEDCIAILDRWRHEQESLSDAVRRMDRHLRKHGESGVDK